MPQIYCQLKDDEASQPVVRSMKHEYAVLHDCQFLLGKAANIWKLKFGIAITQKENEPKIKKKGKTSIPLIETLQSQVQVKILLYFFFCSLKAVERRRPEVSFH